MGVNYIIEENKNESSTNICVRLRPDGPNMIIETKNPCGEWDQTIALLGDGTIYRYVIVTTKGFKLNPENRIEDCSYTTKD